MLIVIVAAKNIHAANNHSLLLSPFIDMYNDTSWAQNNGLVSTLG